MSSAPRPEQPAVQARATHRDPLRVWRQALAAPAHYIRPWYGAYLLLGIVASGMVPVLAVALWSIMAVAFVGMAYKSGCQAISRDRIERLEREGDDALSRNSKTRAVEHAT